jgi:hypothetical protein
MLQTLGNHEFEDKIAGVVPFLETMEAPFVVANIDDSEEPSIQGKYNKSIIIEREGRRIGILGFILQGAYVSIAISDPGLIPVSFQDVYYLNLLSDFNATRLISSTRLRHRMENLTKFKDESLDKTKILYITEFILQ